MKIKPSDCEIAAHEAGHFVFQRALGIGLPRELSIEADGLVGFGRCSRSVVMGDWFVQAEIEGRPLASAIPDATDEINETAIPNFLSGRLGFVRLLILECLAGTGADTALAGGDGRFYRSDIFRARELAALLCPPAAVTPYLQAAHAQVIATCRGLFRNQIKHVAEVLLGRRTLNGPQCVSLWQYVAAEVLTPSAAKTDSHAPDQFSLQQWRGWILRSAETVPGCGAH